jgi:hypothetical protein
MIDPLKDIHTKKVTLSETDRAKERILKFLGKSEQDETSFHELVSQFGKKINTYLSKTRSYHKISPERLKEVSGQINRLLTKGFNDPPTLTVDDVNKLIDIHNKNKQRMWKLFRYLGGKTAKKQGGRKLKSRKQKRSVHTRKNVTKQK